MTLTGYVTPFFGPSYVRNWRSDPPSAVAMAVAPPHTSLPLNLTESKTSLNQLPYLLSLTESVKVQNYYHIYNHIYYLALTIKSESESSLTAYRLLLELTSLTETQKKYNLINITAYADKSDHKHNITTTNIALAAPSD